MRTQLRVAMFQFFPPTLWTPGGGELQLAKTREALQRLGVEAALFNPWSRSTDFDVMHVFGSTYELSSFVKAIKGLGKPVVVSVIAYSSRPSWQWRVWRHVDRMLPVPTVYRLRREIYCLADRLVAASRAEMEQLVIGFGADRAKFRLVRHGIDVERFRSADPALFEKRYGLRDFVLQVSRINRLKGQARLIRALEGTGLQVVFIGSVDPTGRDSEFQDLVRKHQGWVHYLGSIPHDDLLLASAYAAARVHVLPSIIESFGLVTLEAMAAGSAVVSGAYPPLKEYVGDFVYYCDPTSLESIRETVIKAYRQGPKAGVRDLILRTFSWDRAAEQLLAVYQELLA